jgi:hypothetical protein
MLAALVIIASVVGVVGGRRLMRWLEPRPTEEQCAALVDRYLEHASRARDPSIADEDIAEARLRGRDGEDRHADRRASQSELTALQVECALRSATVDELERCLQ